MKHLPVFSLFTLLLIISACKGNQTEQNGDGLDSLATDSISLPCDTTPPPVFVHFHSSEDLMVVYWTDSEEPVRTKDNEEWFDKSHMIWERQDKIKRNARLYTKLFIGNDEPCEVKFVSEDLLNPDGGELDRGQLHSNKWIPSAGLRFEFIDPKKAASAIAEWGQVAVLVTDEYLEKHPVLHVKTNEWNYESSNNPFPKSVLQQLEKKYGMTVERSHIDSNIDGDRYAYGTVQFKVKNKRALALEVITSGEKVWSYPVEGYYDDEYGVSWNVDDEGVYIPSSISMAFQGPEGPQLCYIHQAPESCTVGILRIEGDSLVMDEQAGYYVNIDEGCNRPLWKTDLKKLVKLYNDDDRENKYNTFSKYWFLDIDDDGIQEVWLRDKEESAGAIFTLLEGKPKLICCEDQRLKATAYKGRICLSGPAGGPSYYYCDYVIEGSKVTHKLAQMEVYGEFYDGSYDGKDIDSTQCEKLVRKLPKQELDLWPCWRDIETE